MFDVAEELARGESDSNRLIMLLGCLITAFKIMKVTACCVGNRACYMSRVEII